MKNWEKMRYDPGLREREILGSKTFRWIREFFYRRGFVEIQCPLLVSCPGMEPYLDQIGVDIEDEKGIKYRAFLSTSPEYSMKKMLCAGFEKIYCMTSAFRGKESFGGTHNAEFTILEWYRANTDYYAIMEDVEELITYLAKKVSGKTSIIYQDKKISLKKPWPRIKVREAFLKYSGFDLDSAKSFSELKKIAIKKGYRLEPGMQWDDIFYLMFLNEVEPKLNLQKPVILYEYPLSQAALAKRVSPGSFYAERFELYMGGLELANCFSELVDPEEQLYLLEEEQKLRKKLGKEVLPIDYDFIKALELGIPPSSGIAMGVERLQMLLLNTADINELIPFPCSQILNPHV